MKDTLSPTNKLACVQSPTINPRFTLKFVCLTICRLCNFSCFLLSADFFISSFSKNYFSNIIRMSNSLNPDQTQHFVGPDLGANCL